MHSQQLFELPVQWEWADAFSVRVIHAQWNDRTGFTPPHLEVRLATPHLSPDAARAFAGALLQASETIEKGAHHPY